MSRSRPLRPNYLRHQAVRRSLFADLYEDGEPGMFVSYRQWLIRNGGRPMERALIKAQHRYDKLKPARIRASALHTAYRRKRS